MKRSAVILLAIAGCSQDPRSVNPAAYDGVMAELKSEAEVYFGQPVDVEPIGRTVTGDPCGFAEYQGRTYLILRSPQDVVAIVTTSPSYGSLAGVCEGIDRETPARAPRDLADATPPDGVPLAVQGAWSSDLRETQDRMDRRAREARQDRETNLNITVTVAESR